MSTQTERIKQLHEQASEFYLNGDYRGALQAWRDVLGISPTDEQAMDGVRMASQFVEPEAEAFAAQAPEVEHELDEGLKILDGVGAPALLPSDAADEAIDRKPAAEVHDATATEEIPDGWEAMTDLAPAEESFGLEPLSHSGPGPKAPATAASAELARRVADLLTEAKAKADAGERDEALAILARLGILDEENAQAEALRQQIEAAGASDLDKVEQAIIEGVAALEGDRLDDAERLFREALALAPEHREAQHYLEKVEERRSGGSEDLLGGLEGEAAPAEDAVQRATAAPEAPAKPLLPPKPPRTPAAELPDLPDAPIAASAPRFSLPPTKILIGGIVAAVVLIGGASTLPRLFSGSKPKFETGKPAVVVPHPPRAAKPGGASSKAAAPADARTPAERASAIASSLAAGQARMASGDAGGAVLAFNDVLALDPGNAAAKAGLATAGEQYKATKAERDALNSIKMAFRDGEFTSGLRLAYRLPPTVSKSYVDAVKVAGWYNLAIVALRAGDCREAQAHLDEALSVSPSDDEAKSLREFASRYADAVKDRTFLDRVEALAFRELPRS